MSPFFKSATDCIALLFVLFLSLTSSAAQNKPSSSPDDQPELTKPGTIGGTVVNESGQPLSDATVIIRAFGSTTIRRITTTDRHGDFQVNGLPPVVYLVSAALPAYTLPPRHPDSTQATSYRVGDRMTLVLIKGGVITGRVSTSSGEPVIGVRVRAQMVRDGNGQRTRYGATILERTTDDRGVYRIYGLPTGTYLVSAGGGDSYLGSSAYLNDSPTYSPSSTRDTAAEINVRAGEETSGTDIRYRGEPGHTISGIATGPQGPDASFFVTLTSTLGSQSSENTFQPPGTQGFSFSGVADGDYNVTAQSYFPNGDRWISAPKRIKLSGADITGLELAARPLGSITGRVVLEDSNAAECKGKRRALVTETLVSAWHNENEAAKEQPQFVWSLGGPIYPSDQGDISLRNLAPGQYQIITRLFAKYWYLRSITLPASTMAGSNTVQTSRTNDAVSNWITLRQDDRLSGLIVTLSEGAGSLQGQVTLSEGETPPARLYVYLVPVENEKAQDVLRFFAAPVSTDRKITLNHIPPGRYWILAQPALEDAVPPLRGLRLPDEKESRARLRREGEAGKTEIEFKPCQNITDYQLPLKSSASVPTKQ